MICCNVAGDSTTGGVLTSPGSGAVRNFTEAKTAPVLAGAGSVDVSVTTRAGEGRAALSVQNAAANSPLPHENRRFTLGGDQLVDNALQTIPALDHGADLSLANPLLQCGRQALDGQRLHTIP